MRSSPALPPGTRRTPTAVAAADPVDPLRGADNADGAAVVGPSWPRRLRSEDLLGQGRLLEILHGDAVYRLRVTALGKLILTK